MFRAGKPHWRVGLSGDQLHAAGLQPVSFTAVFDEDPDVVPATPTTIVQVDRAGLYLLHASVGRLGVVVTQAVQVALEVNGVIDGFLQSAGTTGNAFAEVGRLRQLPDDAQLRFLVQGSSLVPTTLRAQFTYFSGARVGPVRWTG